MRTRNREEIRVLHVEDDPQFRNLTSTFLNSINKNFLIKSISDPEKTLEIVMSEGIDCIVSDYDMPKKNGLELLDDVREQSEDIPFILFTGKGTEEIASEAISRGVTDYIQKSGKEDCFELLSNKIQNATERYRNKIELDDVYEVIEMREDGVAIINSNFQYVYANDSYAKIHGYDCKEEVKCRSVHEHYDEETLNFIIENTSERNQTWSGHLVGHTVDGSTFHQNTSISRIDNGHRLIVLRRREEEQKELEIQKREVVLNKLIESIPYGILVEDNSRRVMAVNSSFPELVDIDKDRKDILGMDCEELAHEVADSVANDGFVEEINNLIEERARSLRDEMERTDGRMLERTYIPYESPEGKANMWIVYDVTERRNNLDELKRERDRMSQFASVVSHDLKNPLNVITGRAEMLKEELDSNQHVQPIIDSAHRMDEIISNVERFIREGQSVNDREEVNVRQLAEMTWGNVETKNATLRIEDEFTVRADREKLKSVFENIYCNAVEHAGENVEILIESCDDGFLISDNGPGIPEEHIDNIFDFGYSSETTGTGFGLAIVNEIVEAHGWSVSCYNTSRGATFKITTENL